MTALKSAPLRRETAVSVRDAGQRRMLVAEMFPWGVMLRGKGRRSGYSVPWDAVYALGAKLEVARRRAERKAKEPRGAGRLARR